MVRRTIVLTVGSLLASSWAMAQVRQEVAHEHGRGVLAVAIDGAAVLVELRGPMGNFVGFEHAPVDESEKLVLDTALATLRQPEFLAFDSAAGCTLLRAAVVVSPGEAVHDPAESDDSHATEVHDEHLEIAATYEYACARPERLRSATVRLFERFPATEVLEASVLNAGYAARVELLSASFELALAE